MKEHFKVAAILIVILTIYSIVIYIIAANKNSNSNKENGQVQEQVKEENKVEINENKKDPENLVGDYNIILSPNTIISYIDGEWKENKKFSYQDKKFEVYLKNENQGFKYLTYSDSWKFFDENKNFLDIEDNFFAINTEFEYKFININTLELNENDKNTINNYLNNKGIVFDYDSLTISKIINDINNDGIRDEIFFVSNAFIENESRFNKAFSFGFIKYYDKTEEFYTLIDKIEEVYKIGNPVLQNIIEIENKIYYIVSVEYFSDKGTEHIIYKLENNQLKEVLKTSINNN